MRTIEVPDEVYARAEFVASRDGVTVDSVVTRILDEELPDDADDVAHLFTPERIAELDRIVAEIEAGAKTYTLEEVDAYLEEKKAAYLRAKGL